MHAAVSVGRMGHTHIEISGMQVRSAWRSRGRRNEGRPIEPSRPLVGLWVDPFEREVARAEEALRQVAPVAWAPEV